MFKEDYCSEKLAKIIAKEVKDIVLDHNEMGERMIYSTCTHQIVLKWLREQRHIAILPEVHTHTAGFCWGVSIIDLNKPYDIVKYFNTFEKYENSVDSALMYVFENIIKH